MHDKTADQPDLRFFTESIFKAERNRQAVITTLRLGKRRFGAVKIILRAAHHLGKVGQPKTFYPSPCRKLRRLPESAVTIQKGLILLTVVAVGGVTNQQISVHCRLFKRRAGLGVAGKDQAQPPARLTQEHRAQNRFSVPV